MTRLVYGTTKLVTALLVWASVNSQKVYAGGTRARSALGMWPIIVAKIAVAIPVWQGKQVTRTIALKQLSTPYALHYDESPGNS